LTESQLRNSTGLYTGFAFMLSHPGDKHLKSNIQLTRFYPFSPAASSLLRENGHIHLLRL
jgi:hypothetical protein